MPGAAPAFFKAGVALGRFTLGDQSRSVGLVLTCYRMVTSRSPQGHTPVISELQLSSGGPGPDIGAPRVRRDQQHRDSHVGIRCP